MDIKIEGKPGAGNTFQQINIQHIEHYNILLKKTLKSGGIKVVTYGSLLENPDVFGPGKGLAGAEGEISMVLEGLEEGFSINALYRKYRAQLVGRSNADTYGKDFPLRFMFARVRGKYIRPDR